MNQCQPLGISFSTLYIVPTPIGNLEDITRRALSILQSVDFIAAEHIVHTNLLLQHFNIKTRLLALNKHNEQKKIKFLLTKLQDGQNIALVSDAGTPVINDPGYHLVRCCRESSIRIVPLPGACAAITALSASGLPSDRFCYEGFLPAKRKARLDFLNLLTQEPRTLIFYESNHRLLDSMADMLTTWGPLRYVVMARELSKIWETIYSAPIGKLLSLVQKNEMCRRGEITLIVEGYHGVVNSLSPEVLRTLTLLMAELTFKKAVKIAAEIHGVKKNTLYRYALDQCLKF